jgi:hypothetical protein
MRLEDVEFYAMLRLKRIFQLFVVPLGATFQGVAYHNFRPCVPRHGQALVIIPFASRIRSLRVQPSSLVAPGRNVPFTV